LAEQEQCRPCAEGAFKVSPNDNVPLCQGHWNRFIDTYMQSDGMGGLVINAPCNAHLIGAALTQALGGDTA